MFLVSLEMKAAPNSFSKGFLHLAQNKNKSNEFTWWDLKAYFLLRWELQSLTGVNAPESFSNQSAWLTLFWCSVFQQLWPSADSCSAAGSMLEGEGTYKAGYKSLGITVKQRSHRSDKKPCLVNDLHSAPSYMFFSPPIQLEDKFLLDRGKELI